MFWGRAVSGHWSEGGSRKQKQEQDKAAFCSLKQRPYKKKKKKTRLLADDKCSFLVNNLQNIPPRKWELFRSDAKW